MDTISRTIDEDAFTDKQMARQRHQVRMHPAYN